MTRCPSSEVLRQLLADRLSGPEAEGVEAHVETCVACQQELEQMTGGADVGGRRGLSLRCEPGGDFLRRLERELPTSAWPSPPEDRGARVADAPDGPPQPVRVLLPVGSAPRSAGEVQLLLRKRLRVVCLFFLVLALVVAALLHSGALRVQGRPLSGTSVDITLVWGSIGAFAALAGVLRGTSPIALVWLRVIEGVLFGLASAVFAANLYGNLRGWELLRCAPQGAEGMRMLARATSFGWIVLMILYGLYIPNTARRAAAVVGAMALLLLAVGAAAGLAEAALPRELLGAFLGQLAFCLAIGGVVATLGAARIERLRQEAFEARRFGQYRLKERLGAGGMGEVYLAEHVLLKRPCAIKVIRPERAGDPKNLARFEREVQATVALSHPNIVEVFDYGRAEDGTFYYVMEYLVGLSLEELVRRHGPLPPGRVVHLLRQVCGALQEAHTVGLVHRDIKPGNLLVCRRGGRHDVAKLLDFGLVQALGAGAGTPRLTQEGTLAGTPVYMSPEQAAGRADLGAGSDLYSLGAVAYFLLAGRPPFDGEGPLAVLHAHLTAAVAPPSGRNPAVPADLEAVVLRCLAKDPAARYATAVELGAALAGCGCAGAWTEGDAAAWWAGAPARPIPPLPSLPPDRREPLHGSGVV